MMEMDTADIVFQGNNLSSEINLLGVSSHCYKCDYELIVSVNASVDKRPVNGLDTRWPFLFLLQSGKHTIKKTFHMKEYGKYVLNLTQKSAVDFQVDFILENDPMNSLFPFFMFLAVLAGLAVVWPLSKCIYRVVKGMKSKEANYFMEMEEWENKIDSLSRQSVNNRAEDGAPKPQTPPAKSKRLRSLDTFRGIAIVSMIFVNYGGGHYYFIDHALWNGLTIADLVFPWFIFIMGTSIHLSYKGILKRGTRKRKAFLHILIRSCKLFVIGLVLNQGANLLSWRIPGVLQRFGVCYFVIASLNLLTSPSESTLLRWSAYRCVKPFLDILPFFLQWILILGLVAAHTAMTFMWAVPGCPKGYLGPGGLSEHGKYFNCTGGAAGYIDRLVLGESHLYGGATFKRLYKNTQHFDPEGILGYLPSIVLTFLGLQAGRILFMYMTHFSHIMRWLLWAFVTGGVGFALTLGTLDEGIIPINKNLWSLSFILVTSSLSFVLFSMCYLACDVFKIWNGSPFFFCGMNAIFLYVGHMLIPFNIYWHLNPQSHTSSLVVASFGTTVWVVWAFSLYKKKLFFTV